MSESHFFSLQKTQENFVTALLNVDQVPSCEQLFSTAPDKVADRMAFYRGNVTGNWAQALANAFPVIKQLVGEEFFVELSRQYGRIYPSQSGDLNQFGENFPRFLKDLATVASYPYFFDVATLEWQVHCAYYSANVNAFSWPQFLELNEENIPQRVLTCRPSTTLFSSQWASVQVWHAHQGEEVAALDVPIDQASFALISRQQWTVTVTPLAEASYAALTALKAGKSLEQALETAIAYDENFDIAGQLKHWFEQEAFTKIELLNNWK